MGEDSCLAGRSRFRLAGDSERRNEAVKSVLRVVDQHFFAPARLSDLGLFRIACVTGMLSPRPNVLCESTFMR